MASSVIPYLGLMHNITLDNISTGQIDTQIPVANIISANARNWAGAFCSIDANNGLARIFVHDINGNLLTNTNIKVIAHVFS